MSTAASLTSYWYFHLPNFILAALMYTLLGRALLGVIVQPDSGNYIWRFFCRITDPFIALIQPVTPKAMSAMPSRAQSYCCGGLQSDAPGKIVSSTLPFVRFFTSSTHGASTETWWLWAAGTKWETLSLMIS